MNPDNEPTAEEREEALRLARALERAPGSGDALDDALGAAAFLRHARGAFDLDDERKEVIIERALAEARPVAPSKRSWMERLGFRPWLVLTAALTMTALVLVLRPGPRAVALPSPPLELLRAQGVVASGGNAAELERQMKGYRADVYAALGRRYDR
jgi:hypothetical protein